MIRIGAHVSTAGGVPHAPGNARQIGATAFALFLKNPRGYGGKAFDKVTVDEFARAMDECGYLPAHVVPHVGYLVNLGSPKRDIYEKSLASFFDELMRCELLGLTCLNIHPGSHTGEEGPEASIERIAASVNLGLERSSGVRVLLENTAGQGCAVGSRFEELAALIERIEDKSRIGVCFDTCHAFAAGYDIRTREVYEHTLDELDRVVGLRYLKALHINDTKGELGSHLDRHESLGKGRLGWEPFRLLVNDSRLDEIPMILETIDDTIWDKEIATLYSFIGARPKAGARKTKRAGKSSRVKSR
jgi:deoxyribonuclease-4